MATVADAFRSKILDKRNPLTLEGILVHPGDTEEHPHRLVVDPETNTAIASNAGGRVVVTVGPEADFVVAAMRAMQRIVVGDYTDPPAPRLTR